MKKLGKHYANVASTLALVGALTIGGAYAAGKIGTKQLANNSVTAKKAKFPKARPIRPVGGRASARASVTDSYAPVATLGTYNKLAGLTVLQLNWTGTAGAGFSPCVFQLRVDGKPPLGGGSEVFVQNGATVSVANQALFGGVDSGNHTVAVYARATITGGDFSCAVGGAPGGVAQTVNAVELVQ